MELNEEKESLVLCPVVQESAGKPKKSNMGDFFESVVLKKLNREMIPKFKKPEDAITNILNEIIRSSSSESAAKEIIETGRPHFISWIEGFTWEHFFDPKTDGNFLIF